MTARKLFVLQTLVLSLGFHLPAAETPTRENKVPVLLIVLDGLRPDYISRDLMPNLHALGEAGIVAERHHSVFPSVTRVNASSIATGSYPASHGILYNTIYLPIVSSNKIDTSEADELLKVEKETNGRLLTAPSLGEVMRQQGKRLFVAGSSSTGTSLLLNHKVTGDGIWNSRGFFKPAENQERATKALGPFIRKKEKPSTRGNRWAVRAILEHAGKEKAPDAMILWLTDPDGVAHQSGVGSPETIEAIRHVDAEIGYLLEGLNKLGRKMNIFVSTDHGFSTYTGGFNLKKLLSDHSLDQDVTIVANQIYVKDRNAEKIRSIVRVLQDSESVGAIFTRPEKPGNTMGSVPGTLSFDVIHWNHERSADILVDSNWSDATNTFGYRGTTTSGGGENGTAGHGTTSPYDLNIRLIASGPDLKRALHSKVPTGNIDLAPTILHLLGIEPPKSMNGRILTELLRDGLPPEQVTVKTAMEKATHTTARKTYEVELKRFTVGATDYIDFTKTTHKSE